MNKVRNHIPNFITLLNLLSGSIAVLEAFSGNLVLAGWLILIAAFFDFLDGFIARLLNAGSEIGAQLDSLADVVSFGLAPSAIIHQYMLQSNNLPELAINNTNILPYLAFLLVLSAAYRLAKFNIDPGQAKVFKGLPTPATGLFVAALPFIRVPDAISGLISLGNYYVLLSVTLFFSWIMVSSIPVFSLKFKSTGWKGNEPRYLLAASFIIMLAIFKLTAIPLTILLYIIISILLIPGPKKNTGDEIKK